MKKDEEILNEARDFIKRNPGKTVYDFLETNGYTQQALGTYQYNHLVDQLAKKFEVDSDEIKCKDLL